MSEYGSGSASTDGKGHGDPLRVKFPPGVLIAAQRVVAAQKLPYRTVQDLVRDGLVKLLERIEDEGCTPEASDATQLAVLALKLERRVAEGEVYQKIGDQFEKAVQLAQNETELHGVLDDLDEVLKRDLPPVVRTRLELLQSNWKMRR